MKQQQSDQKVIRNISLSSILIIGGLVCLSWLLLTPSGIFGKADAIGYAVCHRIDNRSFHLETRQLPLCVRCTGQYLGAVIGLSFLAFTGKRRSGLPPKSVVAAMVVLTIIFLIDGLNSYLFLPPFFRLFPNMPHLYEPSHTLRLITGTGMGLSIAVVLYPAFWGSILINADIHPAIHSLAQFILLIIAGVVLDLIILTQSVVVLLPAALISTAGVIIILTMVYTIIWLRILAKQNQYNQLSQISLYILAGFLTAMIQVALLDLIRYIITGTWNGLFFS
jgi:uncharacterized membrane protein